jgi:hypothetical protein
MKAKVKNIPLNTLVQTKTGQYQRFFSSKIAMVGKVINVEYNEGEDAFYDGKFWWCEEWLDFSPEATQETLEQMREKQLKETKPKREAKIINTEENPDTLALLNTLNDIPKPIEHENQEKLF